MKKTRGRKVNGTAALKPVAKTVKPMRTAAKAEQKLTPAAIGMVRDGIIKRMKALDWSTYQLWKASNVPRTIVYTFIGKDDGRDINLRHAEAMMLAVGISLKVT